jgi:hypothetical protein
VCVCVCVLSGSQNFHSCAVSAVFCCVYAQVVLLFLFSSTSDTSSCEHSRVHFEAFCLCVCVRLNTPPVYFDYLYQRNVGRVPYPSTLYVSGLLLSFMHVFTIDHHSHSCTCMAQCVKCFFFLFFICLYFIPCSFGSLSQHESV